MKSASIRARVSTKSISRQRKALIAKIAAIEATRDAGGLWWPIALQRYRAELKALDEGCEPVGLTVAGVKVGDRLARH